MDGATLNRLGILVELFGTILAAPELIDRMLGWERLAVGLRRWAWGFTSLVEAYLRAFTEAPTTAQRVAVALALASLADYSVVYFVAFALLALSGGLSDLGWCSALWLIGVWPALLFPGVFLLSIRDAIVVRRANLLQSFNLAVLFIPSVPVVLLLAHVTIIVAPALVLLAPLSRRLEARSLRSASLLIGGGLFVTGLLLQLLSTL